MYDFNYKRRDGNTLDVILVKSDREGHEVDHEEVGERLFVSLFQEEIALSSWGSARQQAFLSRCWDAVEKDRTYGGGIVYQVFEESSIAAAKKKKLRQVRDALNKCDSYATIEKIGIALKA